MSNMYYLAAPYTDPNELIRKERVRTADMVAAALMEQHGFCIYSPLTHSQAVVPFLSMETIQDHNFWMRQCLPMVKAASALLLLELDGWKESKGVKMEVDAAKALMMPIYRVLPHGRLAPVQSRSPDTYQRAMANDGLILFRIPQERDPFSEIH